MSAVIAHFHYKPESRELSIWLGSQRRRYRYFDVPPAVHQALADAPSQGRYFNQTIRDHYACERVDETEPRRRRPRSAAGAAPISPTMP